MLRSLVAVSASTTQTTGTLAVGIPAMSVQWRLLQSLNSRRPSREVRTPRRGIYLSLMAPIKSTEKKKVRGRESSKGFYKGNEITNFS